MSDTNGEGAIRVLVAEDHPTNQQVMQSMLHRLGYASTLAEDGLEALAAFEAEPGAFALVLMDCHMPNLDGCEATRLIRERERELGLAPIPILAVTASVFPEDRHKVEAAGMDGFLAKPLALSTLRDALEATLRGAGPEAPPPDEDAGASMAARARELLLIGGPGLVSDVHHAFVREAGRISVALSRDFHALNSPEVRGHAHQLKGTALNVGASALAELARRLEVAAHSGTLAGASGVLRALLAELAEVAEALHGDAIAEVGDGATQ